MTSLDSGSVARTRPAFDFENFRIGRAFYTADWHLGHERILELCDRPFGSVAEMNKTVLERVNAVVTSRDTLVILGDVIMGKFEDTVRLLARVRAKRIWIIPGNHDRFSLAYGHRGAPETQRIKRELWRTQYQTARGGVHGRRSSGIRAEPDLAPSVWHTEIGTTRVALSHYPYVGDSQADERHRWLRPRDAGLPLIHGHVHTRWQTNGRMFNVGVDVNDFAPVSEKELAQWLGRLRLEAHDRVG